MGENEFSGVAVPERLIEFKPEWGIVLGSGLGGFVDEFRPLGAIGFHEIAGLPVSTVPGHAGRFVWLEILGQRVIIAQGRSHLYEGLGARQVAAGVRFMAAAGISKLILSNAAGAIHPAFSPGSWMMIEDHLNLTGASPLTGVPDFADMSEVYSQPLREHFARSAGWEGVVLHRGIYAGVPGPQYETPAEVRMLRALGADAVGMSTVIEAIQARSLGIEVAGFSFMTNRAAGLGGGKLDHASVLGAAKAGAVEFSRIVARALDTLGRIPPVV